MSQSPNAAEVAIVILSCDKYSDLWPPFFELFFQAWKGSTLPVYLCANRRSLDDPRVTMLLSGEDPDWSTSIRASLQQIDHDYVLLVFDDIFFDGPVDPARLGRLIDFIGRKHPTYLRFRPTPKPDERTEQHFGRIREDTIYRTSIFGIWRRATLVELMQPGESAWEFEYNSPARAKHLPDFYGVYERHFSYVHGIEKGAWIPRAVDELKALGVEPDLGRRAQMPDTAYRTHRRAMLREKVFNKAPAFLRPILIAAKRQLFGGQRR